MVAQVHEVVQYSTSCEKCRWYDNVDQLAIEDMDLHNQNKHNISDSPANRVQNIMHGGF